MAQAIPGEVAGWLAQQGGPAVRYQALALLPGGGDKAQLAEARAALECADDTLALLERLRALQGRVNIGTVHGAPNHQLENILPMLVDRGLDRSFPAFDAAAGALLPELERLSTVAEGYFASFVPIIVIPWLVAAGYREGWMLAYLRRRLGLVAAFCAGMDFDIFGDQDGYKGVPMAFRNRQVIRPQLYENGDYRFPLIHDLYGWRAMYPQATAQEREMIDTALAYTLAPGYQRFPRGYGILQAGPVRYHAMGWDAMLPCPGADGELTAAVLHRLELLAGFPTARQAPWFRQNLALLQRYRQPNGSYALPRAALAEREGYWVLAHHMGLGENRRKKSTLLLEGTLRACRLLAAMGDGAGAAGRTEDYA